jgi:hypothetical protein
VETVRESFHHIEIDRQADADVLDGLRLDLIRKTLRCDGPAMGQGGQLLRSWNEFG